MSLSSRYTELEAEVEAEGPFASRWKFWTRKGGARDGQMRLESSLTAALEASRARFILLEGDPGSGKTVSLRRVERTFAQRIHHEPKCALPMPLYVNLKYMAADARKPVVRLRETVLQAIHDDMDMAAHLFDDGTLWGGWLLLLDGFDEIPGVLGAVEADVEVRAYTEAILDFCDPLHRDPRRTCRVVVSTRHYHGPKNGLLVSFRLRPLSDERRRTFIANFGLTAAQASSLTDTLATARLEIQQWAHNPLMLTMLCEVTRNDREFPESIHSLFKKYLVLRFQRDAGRLRELYQGSAEALRLAAENIAFVMSAEPGLGQAPTNRAIGAALERHGLPVGDVARASEAIARLELALLVERDHEVRTCFRHRRLQEYFATCVLLREPDRVPVNDLLFDGRWREAAVVLLQGSRRAELDPLLARAEEFLRTCRLELDVPVADVELDLPGPEALAWTAERLTNSDPPRRLRWPPRLFHLMSLLEAGFAYGNDMPRQIRGECLTLLVHIYRTGVRIDRKYALELIGLLPNSFAEGFCLAAFDSDSELLHDLAFKQCPRLGRVPEAARRHISRFLFRMARTGKIEQERLATAARIRRLHSPELETLFEMASTAAAVGRTARRSIILLGLLAGIVAGLFSPVPLQLAIVVGLLVTPALFALMIPSTAHLGLLALRGLLESFSVMVLPMLMSFVLLGQSAAALVVFLIGFVVATYVYTWEFLALQAVRDGLPVERRDWPMLPIHIFVAHCRRRPVLALIPLALVVFLGFVIYAETTLPRPPDWVVLVIVSPLSVVGVGLALLVARVALMLGSDAWTERGYRRAGSAVLTVAELKARLGRLYTGSARVRLLRNVLRKRPLALAPLDDGMRAELELFVDAVETHAAALKPSAKDGGEQVPRLRVLLPQRYVAECTSNDARWCLAHCRTIEAVYDLPAMVDLLTELLERADRTPGTRPTTPEL
ncbi:NACHT domain-containing protein [Nannocystis pusilla]|uniref:NACHT domain-containing protein n=1 Tax=Nannocystis pusilla TaxID=889268 RepID=A0ABS7TN27_9BACT|nr:NACHT domain-containing protein [Nannocystis pusilla]